MAENAYHLIIDFNTSDALEVQRGKKVGYEEEDTDESGFAYDRTMRNYAKEITNQQKLLKLSAVRAVSLLERGIMTSLNQYTNLSENYIAGNTIANVKTSVSMITGMAAQVAVGAKLGGFYGGAAAAAMGTVGLGIQLYNRYSSYYSSLNATNAQTSWDATRLGLVNNGRGTEN